MSVMLDSSGEHPVHEELVERFREDCLIRNIGATKIYVLYAQQFACFLDGRGKIPQDVSKDDLKDYLISLRNRELKPVSIDRVFTCLSQFYAFLLDEELILANPIGSFRRRYLRKFKESTSEPRQLITVEQASQLVNSVLNSRDKTIITLLFKTGVRRSELCGLDVSDVNLERMEIMLKPTAKRSNRLLFIDYETQEVIEMWLKVRASRKPAGEALFYSQIRNRISPAQVDDIVKRHATRVGLHNPSSQSLKDRFTPHCCRHFFTTHLLRAGMQREHVKWLRGDLMREAIDIYNHIDPKDVKGSYLACIPQLGV